MAKREVLNALPQHPVASHVTAQAVLRALGGAQPREFAPADLAQFPHAAIQEDFVCEEGWEAPRQAWRGVLAGALLDAAGIPAETPWVEFASGDFCFSLPAAQARAALIATELNGEAIPREHGGPYRLLVSGAACFTSIKWLDRIEARESEGANTAETIARARIAPR